MKIGQKGIKGIFGDFGMTGDPGEFGEPGEQGQYGDNGLDGQKVFLLWWIRLLNFFKLNLLGSKRWSWWTR